MIKSFQLIRNFLSNGQERSIKTKKNIIYSFLLKIISVIVSFILVPITLHYLGVKEYGIWLTLSSILGWISFFDIGLGNGLRNKLTESFAKNDQDLARIYVSTTYASLTIIFLTILAIFLVVNNFVDWTKILNTSPSLRPELTHLVQYVIVFMVLRLILLLISTILTADQEPAIANSFDVLANIISLVFIIILQWLEMQSLLFLGITYSAAPVLVLFVASLYFFKDRYKALRPSIKFVDFHYFKELGSLGVKFLFIQLAFLLLFTINNFVISYFFGPEQVTPYNIAYKYFSTVYMVFTLILNPFWSAFTDAYVKNDISWIKNSLNKLVKIWILACGGILLMIILANTFYKIWVGPEVHIPIMLSVTIGIFIAIFSWFNIFCFFINGTGKITLQLIVYIIAAVLNLPFIWFFAVYLKLGVVGVVIANILIIMPIAVFMPLQTYKIIGGNAKGIWNK